MKLGTIIKTSFILSLVLTIAGAYLRIIHAEGSEPWLVTAIIVSMVFIVSAIYEVRTSRKINGMEKTMWTLAFIFFSYIAGFIYILAGRRRIASNT